MIQTTLCALVLLTPPTDIGSSRQLFVDHALTAASDRVTLELGEPRDEGEVFRFDAPWEGPFSAYATVIHDPHDGRYLLYYRGLPSAGAGGTARETTCVATSDDGISWTRPALGQFEVDGTRENNAILANAAPVTHNFSPFIDTNPGADPAQRFKALGGDERSGLIAYTSPDGLTWTRLRDEPVVRGGLFDSQNVAFWWPAEEQYVCYLRTWTGEGYRGFRSVSRATSPDFVEWTAPEQMSFGDGPLEHIYTNQTHPYFRAPHIAVAIAARFMPGRQVVDAEAAKRLGVDPRYFKDCSDAILMTSRGGTTYDRTFREALIRPGIGLENWVSRSNYPALNIVQTGPSEMSLYVSQNYAQPTAHLRRYSMRLDGLASLSADAETGSWHSNPITFEGDRLEINFATSAAGGIRVELQDEDGAPIPGFTIDECVEQIGNEITRVVSWQNGSDVSAIAGRAVRLHVRMRDADLYSFRFARTAPRLTKVERIWGDAAHSAFTDLLRVGDELYCAFREGEAHVHGADGTIRVIARGEFGWRTVAHLEEAGVDLRDPKLSIAPDGRVVILCGGSIYEDRTLIGRRTRVAFLDPASGACSNLRPVVIDEAVRTDDDWLWRITWHEGRAYGVVYQATHGWKLHLVTSDDGVRYDLVTTLPEAGNETTLDFLPSGEMVAVVRRRGTALFGTAPAPSTDWSFTELPEFIGGPDMIATGDGRWLVGGRRNTPNGPVTALSRHDADGTWKTLVELPSGGDTSYPGFVLEGDRLLMSYYSSHEGKSAVFLATFELP